MDFPGLILGLEREENSSRKKPPVPAPSYHSKRQGSLTTEGWGAGGQPGGTIIPSLGGGRWGRHGWGKRELCTFKIVFLKLIN